MLTLVGRSPSVVPINSFIITRDYTISNTISKELHKYGIKTMAALEVGKASDGRSPCKRRLLEP